MQVGKPPAVLVMCGIPGTALGKLRFMQRVMVPEDPRERTLVLGFCPAFQLGLPSSIYRQARGLPTCQALLGALGSDTPAPVTWRWITSPGDVEVELGSRWRETAVQARVPGDPLLACAQVHWEGDSSSSRTVGLSLNTSCAAVRELT